MRDGIAGIILAGGHATRMGGGDKCLLPLDDQPILSHVIRRLRPQVGPIALNANGDPSRFAGFDIEVVLDVAEGYGPLGGLLSGMRWAAALSCPRILTVAADTPFFPTNLAKTLVASATDPGSIVLASSAGILHPTFALWPVSLAGALQAFLDEKRSFSVRSFAETAGTPGHVDFPFTGALDPFFNINTPEELASAQEFARNHIP